MIIDRLANWRLYANVNPLFQKAFEFLEKSDLSGMECGRYDIAGDDAYAMIQEPEGKTEATAKVEVHRKYIDIHAPIAGEETIGTFTMTERELALPFNEKDDYVLFAAKGEPLTLRVGEFAAFFPPYGGHRHGCTGAKVPPKGYRKICMKVKAEK